MLTADAYSSVLVDARATLDNLPIVAKVNRNTALFCFFKLSLFVSISKELEEDVLTNNVVIPSWTCTMGAFHEPTVEECTDSHGNDLEVNYLLVLTGFSPIIFHSCILKNADSIVFGFCPSFPSRTAES